MKKDSSSAVRIAASALLASAALFFIPVVAHAEPALESPEAPADSSSAAVLGEEQRYIVQYGDHVNSEAASSSLEQQGIEVKETLSHAMKASVVVATPGEIENLQNSADVASVELDTPVSVFGATSIWGLDRVDQRSGRDGQYSIGDEGAGVNIYVVDTGVNSSHTDFSGRVPTGWSVINDGRGFQDCSGHGTHVAGTAAGTMYGVAKKANIIPVRVLQCDGSGWSSTVMAGIDWAISHHVAGQPAVMNLSLGGFTNSSFDAAIQSAVDDGITVVAAAGNDGVDACGASPARVPSAITVGATTIDDAQVTWSNHGPCVDIQAPGVSVRSAWINSSTAYNTLNGTSMAAPHVAGAAAIMLSRDRGLSPSQVHQTVITNATTGIITPNRSTTPNRLLFIPAPTPALPSCSNLRLGDAWAGVGLHCGRQGSDGSAAAPLAEETGLIEVPAATAVEAPVAAPVAAPDQAPESTPDIAPPVEKLPAPAPQVPERATFPGPVQPNTMTQALEPADVPLAAQQVQSTFPGSNPAGSADKQDGTVADPDTAVAMAGGHVEDAEALTSVAGTTDAAWAYFAALVLAILLVAVAVNRRKVSRTG